MTSPLFCGVWPGASTLNASGRLDILRVRIILAQSRKTGASNIAGDIRFQTLSFIDYRKNHGSESARFDVIKVFVK